VQRKIPDAILKARGQKAQTTSPASDPQVTTTIATSSQASQQPPMHVADKQTVLKLKSLLNKLTEENYERLLGQFLDIPNLGVILCEPEAIEIFFEKVESDWRGTKVVGRFAPLYAQLCFDLKKSLKSRSPNVNCRFIPLIITRCHRSIESIFDLSKKSNDEQEQLDEKMKKFGCVGRFITELSKRNLMKPSHLLEFVGRLLAACEKDSPEIFVTLSCLILKELGIHSKESKDASLLDGLSHIFETIGLMVKSDKLSKQCRFALLDLIDLRNAGWVTREEMKEKEMKEKEKKEKEREEEEREEEEREEREKEKKERGKKGKDLKSINPPPPTNTKQSSGDAHSSSTPVNTRISPSGNSTSKRTKATSIHNERTTDETSTQSSSSRQQRLPTTGDRDFVTPNSSNRVGNNRPLITPPSTRASPTHPATLARPQIAPTPITTTSSSPRGIVGRLSSALRSLSPRAPQSSATTSTTRKPMFKLGLGSKDAKKKV
jgi:hypothetical protein